MQSSTLALLQGDDEGEESVDAIAKELEKSDSADAKRSPKGAKGSPKKGKKPAMEGEKSKEEWVDLIFGANGEKVTNILNTLHNSKRLGPFLGFGHNFGEKQNEYPKTGVKSVCLM